jgi:hypothetical protein
MLGVWCYRVGAMGFVVGLRVGLALWMGCSGVVAVERSLWDGCCRVAHAKLGCAAMGLMGSCWRVEMAGYGALVFTAAVTTSEVTNVRVRKAKS